MNRVVGWVAGTGSGATRSATLTGTTSGHGVVVAITIFDSEGDVTVSSVDVSGQAASAVGSLSGTTGNKCHLYYLAALSSGGDKTVTVTFSGTPGNAGAIAAATYDAELELDDEDGGAILSAGSPVGVRFELTTTAASDLAIVLSMGTDDSDGIGGVTREVISGFDSAFDFSRLYEDLDAGSAGSITIGFETGGSVSTFSGKAAVFKSAAGDVQLLSPIQDIATGTWLPSSGSPAELWQMIDGEKSPDSDYDYTTAAGTMEVKFGPGSTPTLQTGHTLRYRLRGNGTCDALVKLKVGSTVLAQWTETNVPAVDTDYSHTLDSSPSFTISDYSDLRISVEAVP
jgi:hypothetical protein